MVKQFVCSTLVFTKGEAVIVILAMRYSLKKKLKKIIGY
jgi:hypothetical protein